MKKSYFAVIGISVVIALVATFSSMSFSDATGNKIITVGGGKTYYDTYDEDTMSSDSATGLATQQSIKAYVDNSFSNVSVDGSDLLAGNLIPLADDTYYVGKHSGATSIGYKGLILKDSNDGHLWKFISVDGSVVGTQLD